MEFCRQLTIFLVLCLGSSNEIGAISSNSTSYEAPPLPCPCIGQPEGVVIPHPADCRAYYTCLGGSHVLHSRCGDEDTFFHPYMRSCVQRSTFVSFIPDFIPTKDVCKITAVFPAPAMEDFGNCTVKSDEASTGLTSDERIINEFLHTTTNIPSSTTPLPGLESILSMFPWSTRNRNDIQIPTSPSSDNVIVSTTPSMEIYMDKVTEVPILISNHNPTTFASTTKPTEHCKIATIVIHHFPGPCKTDITCEGGAKLTIDKCQSSLSFVSL